MPQQNALITNILQMSIEHVEVNTHIVILGVSNCEYVIPNQSFYLKDLKFPAAVTLLISLSDKPLSLQSKGVL